MTASFQAERLLQTLSGARAVCSVSADTGTTGAAQQPIAGTITLRQKNANSALYISVSLAGFNTSDANTEHGFHIHAAGDVGGECANMGGHFNPHDVAHGLAGATPRHVGDLGNIVEDSWGRVHTLIKDDQASLFDDGTDNYVGGLGFVIHEENDKGTGSSGDAAGRLACCVIH